MLEKVKDNYQKMKEERREAEEKRRLEEERKRLEELEKLHQMSEKELMVEILLEMRSLKNTTVQKLEEIEEKIVINKLY